MAEELTPKQQRFAEEYIVDLNATQAAMRAGYSEDAARQIGSENLSKPYIQDAIQKAMEERSKRTQITADYVLSGIRDTVERCRQAVPVLDQEGKPTGVYRFNSRDALKGFELLGKHRKLFTERAEISGINGRPIGVEHTSNLRHLSDAQLNAMVLEHFLGTELIVLCAECRQSLIDKHDRLRGEGS